MALDGLKLRILRTCVVEAVKTGAAREGTAMGDAAEEAVVGEAVAGKDAIGEPVASEAYESLSPVSFTERISASTNPV